VLQLHRWGLLPAIERAGTPPIRTTTFHYGDEAVEIAIPSRDGVSALFAPRRTVLDRVLVDAARDAGVEVLHETTLIDLVRSGDGSVRGAIVSDRQRRRLEIRAGLVIGADGLRSSVARLVQAETCRHGRHACGVVYGYWAEVPVHGTHWYFRPEAGAGAIPTNDGLTCMFGAVPAAQFARAARLDPAATLRGAVAAAAPELAESVERGRQAGPLRGFAGEIGFMRRCAGPGWALVGDAGYFRDPLTAHGITDALRDAEILARAVVQGSPRALAEYQEIRDDLAVGLFEASDRIASFEWDLPTVAERHRFMSKEMAREAAWLAQLDAPDAAPRPEPRAAVPA
jgi:2-polyprenyl-6-methoxyphenol hydroxylase-like FAD-dependent oxidoreductase